MNHAKWEELLATLIEATKRGSALWKRTDRYGSFVLAMGDGSVVVRGVPDEDRTRMPVTALTTIRGIDVEVRDRTGQVLDQLESAGLANLSTGLSRLAGGLAGEPTTPMTAELARLTAALGNEIAARQTTSERVAQSIIDQLRKRS